MSGPNGQGQELNSATGTLGGSAGIDRRRLLRAAGYGAAASAALPVLGACGFGGAQNKSGGSEAADVTGAFDWKRAKGTTIRALLNKHPYQEALVADLKRFTQLTGIKVEYDVFPEQNYFDKVTLDLSSGQARYDVFMLGAYMVWQYGPPGWLEDLGPWIKNSAATGAEYDWEDVYPNLRASDQWDFKPGSPLGVGGQYALPWGFETNTVAYQSDVFKKMGLKPPETLDELTEQAVHIKKNAAKHGFGDMYGVAVRGTREWATIHPGFMTMYSRLGEKDFALQGGKLKPVMNTPGAIEFHRRWAQMIKDGGPPSWTSYTWYRASGDLGARKAAMLFDADNAAYNQNQPGASPAAGKIAWHPGPKGPDGSLATNLWVWSLGMNSKSKSKLAAWLFLQWATGKDHLLLAARDHNHVDPVRKSVADDAQFKNKMQRNIGYLDTFNEVIPHTKIQFTPQPQFFDATTSWAAALQKIYGGADAKETLDSLVKDLESRS